MAHSKCHQQREPLGNAAIRLQTAHYVDILGQREQRQHWNQSAESEARVPALAPTSCADTWGRPTSRAWASHEVQLRRPLQVTPALKPVSPPALYFDSVLILLVLIRSPVILFTFSFVAML